MLILNKTVMGIVEGLKLWHGPQLLLEIYCDTCFWFVPDFSKNSGVCFLAVSFDQTKITGAGNMAQSEEALGTQVWWFDFCPRDLWWKKRPDYRELFSDLHMPRSPVKNPGMLLQSQDSKGKTGRSMGLTSQPGWLGQPSANDRLPPNTSFWGMTL